MDFELSEKHKALQARVRAYCERELAPNSERWDREEKFPWEAVEGLKREGLLGIPFPKEYGGSALDAVSLCLILEELGRVDPAIALTVESHNGLCSNHIFIAGSEAQKKKYLPRLTSGEALGAWALTEPSAGSDANSLKTTAVRRNGGWVINGTKTFTTQGSVAGIYLLFAQTGKGLSAFVVEKGTPGLSVGKIEHKMGLRHSDTAQLDFHDMKVGEDQLVGRQDKAFYDAMKVLDAGRVAISGISVGIAHASVAHGTAWVKARLAEFGVGEGPGLTGAQKLLADLATEVEAARLLMFRAAALMDAGKPFSREASMAKLFSGDLAMKAPTMILDLMGPAGALLDNPVQRLFRDAKLYQIGEGSSQIQELIISRQMLELGKK